MAATVLAADGKPRFMWTDTDPDLGPTPRSSWQSCRSSCGGGPNTKPPKTMQPTGLWITVPQLPAPPPDRNAATHAAGAGRAHSSASPG